MLPSSTASGGAKSVMTITARQISPSQNQKSDVQGGDQIVDSVVMAMAAPSQNKESDVKAGDKIVDSVKMAMAAAADTTVKPSRLVSTEPHPFEKGPHRALSDGTTPAILKVEVLRDTSHEKKVAEVRTSLKEIRDILTDLDATTDETMLNEKLTQAEAIFCKGAENLHEIMSQCLEATQNEELLPDFYFTKLLNNKILKKKDEAWVYPKMFKGGNENKSAQCIVVDHYGQAYLERRGGFKRLFANKLTATHNVSVKTEDSRQELHASLSNNPLFGDLEIEVKSLSKEKQTETSFLSKDFIAFDEEEFQKLNEFCSEMKESYEQHGIELQLDSKRRVLTAVCLGEALSKDPQAETKLAMLEQITQKTGIKPLFPVKETLNHSLFKVQLSQAQSVKLDYKVKEKERMLSEKSNFEKADADSFELVPYQGIEGLKQEDLATDVLGLHYHGAPLETAASSRPASPASSRPASPASSRPASPTTPVLIKEEPLITDIAEQSQAKPRITVNFLEGEQPVDLVGGKGMNLGKLTTDLTRVSGLCEVPAGFTVTTETFLEGTKSIAEKKIQLEELSLDYRECSDPKIKDQLKDSIIKKAAEIKNDILDMSLSEDIKGQIFDSYNTLSEDEDEFKVAVRSSGTGEDTEGVSAAGMAISILTVDKSNLIDSVKKVWASLYDQEYVVHRLNSEQTQLAKMGVVVQKMIQAEKSGVLMSTVNERPVMRIAGNFGFGEATVGGECGVDSYYVSSTGVVLEKHVKAKTHKYVADSTSYEGVKKIELEEGQQTEQVLTDEESIQLAKIAEEMKKHYSGEIDMEWVIADGKIYIVQCRDEVEKTKDASETTKLEVVDTSSQSSLEFIRLPGLKACAGVTRGTLRCVASTEATAVQKGDIIYTEFTNNQWNEALSGGVSGVITQQGDYSSHAAKNSREYDLPCLVGIGSEMDEKIRSFDGELVTLDTTSGHLYLGHLPSKHIEVTSKMWKDRDELAAVKQAHEKEESGGWDRLEAIGHTMVSGVSGQQFIGRPKIEFSCLQTDVYERGWQRMYKTLDEFSKSKDKQTLEELSEGPLVHNFVKEGVLYRPFEGNEREQIIAKAMHQFTLEDYEDFLLMKQEKVMGLEHYFNALDSGAEDVDLKEVIDKYEEYMSWMHTAHYLDVTFKRMFSDEHLDAIDTSWLNEFENAAMEGALYLNKESQTDAVADVATEPESPAEALLRFQKRDLLRKKTRLEDRILAIIISDSTLKKEFEKGEKSFANFLESSSDATHQKLLSKINTLANHYKSTSEDLTKQNTQVICLQKLLEKSKANDPNYIERLAHTCEHLKGDEEISSIEDLEQLVATKSKLGQLIAVFSARGGEDVENKVVLEKIIEKLEAKKAKRQEVKATFSEYPTLERVAQFSYMEGRLREDSHQAVVKIQLKLKEIFEHFGGEIWSDCTVNELIALKEDCDDVTALQQTKKDVLSAERDYEGRQYIKKKGDQLLYEFEGCDISLEQLKSLEKAGLIEKVNGSGRNNFIVWNCYTDEGNRFLTENFNDDLSEKLKLSYVNSRMSYKNDDKQASTNYVEKMTEYQKTLEVQLQKEGLSTEIRAEIQITLDKITQNIKRGRPLH